MDDPKSTDGAVQMPPILRNWIVVASKGLCSSAKDRIRAEITDHYRQSIEEEPIGIDTDFQRQCDLIERFGSPVEANRRYQKVFMTAKEEIVLTKVDGTRPNRRFGKIAFYYLAFFGAAELIRTGNSFGLVIPILIGILIFVIPRLRKFGYRPMLFARFITLNAFMFGVIGVSFEDWYLALVLIGAASTWNWFSSLRTVIPKLRNHPVPPEKWGDA
jgi:hypothetical protein